MLEEAGGVEVRRAVASARAGPGVVVPTAAVPPMEVGGVGRCGGVGGRSGILWGRGDVEGGAHVEKATEAMAVSIMPLALETSGSD